MRFQYSPRHTRDGNATRSILRAGEAR
jgi:hypothetical protein